METLNGIEEAEWYAEGVSSSRGFLRLHCWAELSGKEMGQIGAGREGGTRTWGRHESLCFSLPDPCQSCTPPSVPPAPLSLCKTKSA